MSDEGQTSTARAWISNHPELVGYMFAIMLAWSSVGTAAASWGSPGP